MTTIENTKGYAYYQPEMGKELSGKPNDRHRKTMTVTFITDMVPGAFHNPKDLMEWIAQNPYVASVTYEGE